MEKVPVFQWLRMGVEAGGHTENHEERWTQNTKTKKIDEWEINNIIQAKVKTAEITLESDVSDQIGHTGSPSLPARRPSVYFQFPQNWKKFNSSRRSMLTTAATIVNSKQRIIQQIVNVVMWGEFDIW